MYEKVMNWVKDHSDVVMIGGTLIGELVGFCMIMKWCVKLTTKAITDGINASKLVK